MTASAVSPAGSSMIMNVNIEITQMVNRARMSHLAMYPVM